VQATSGDGEGASVRYSNESFNSLEIYHLRWVIVASVWIIFIPNYY
jgi:hypothetical protein